MSKSLNNLSKSLEDTLDLSNYAPAEHGSHLNLGTDSNSAFRGDYGQVAYAHSQVAHAPSNAQKNSNITKAEIEAKLTGNITSHAHSIYASSNTIGTLSTLKTTNKSNVIESINEIYQDVDSGKQMLSNAIGDSSITKNSTFSDIGNAISIIKSNSDEVLNKIKNLLELKGIYLSPDVTLDEIMALLAKSNMYAFSVKDISCMSRETLILKNDGTVWTCGDNYFGQLGLGDIDVRHYTFTKVATNGTNVKQVSCGDGFCYILKNDGTLYSAGSNSWGTLGFSSSYSGYQSATSSSKILSTFTQVPNISNVKEIHCGAGAAIALKNDGTLWATGTNSYCGLGTSGTSYGFTKINLSINGSISKIACGRVNVYILTSTGYVYGAGYGSSGQLGRGSSNTGVAGSFVQIASGVQDIVASSSGLIYLKNNNIYATGDNSSGQLGLPSKTEYYEFTQITDSKIVNNVSKIFGSGERLYILKNDGNLFGCGNNYSGSLGDGEQTTSSDILKQIIVNDQFNANDIKKIVCSDYVTFIYMNDGGVFYAGGNYYGNLGFLDKNSENTDKYNFTRLPL